MAMDLGVRSWGTSPSGSTRLLIGSDTMRSAVSARLLDALPAIVSIRGDQWDSPLLELLADEMGKDQPGQVAILDRLLDALLLSTVRAWFDIAGDEAPGWYRAARDPTLSPAIAVLHHEPARAWTVADLATEAGVSGRRWRDGSTTSSVSRQ